MKIVRLKTNHIECPLGFEMKRALLSWCTEGCSGQWQAISRVQLALAPGEAPVYDSGYVQTVQDKDTGIVISGMDNLGWELPFLLEPRTRYYWRVYVKTDAGEACWSDWTWFETARAEGEAWRAMPLRSPLGAEVHPVFAKHFTVDRPVASARMYCLGLGEYEAYLDAVKLGDEVLLPGFHAYDGYLQYQTFELSLAQGDHTLAFLLGDGWYKGRYGLKASVPRYGTDYVLLAEIRIRYADGTEAVIGTDPGWLVYQSPVTFDSIYDGETVDMRLLSAANGAYAEPALLDMALLVPRVSPRIRIQERMQAQWVGENIFDFGQNIVGWVEFLCDAPAGTQITLRFAEVLKDGRMYFDNLRSAKATFTYISDGQTRLVRPHFTFFGFRYVSIEGWTPSPEALRGCVIHSDMERTGWMKTSNEKLDRLFENAIWSQKGNFIDIPTDCPQRDERMGWTGDIQIFSDTALYNMDCFALLSKFLRDLRWDQQKMGGNVPCVTPMTNYWLGGVAGWGDAAAIVPWHLYLHSGDREILRSSLQSMMDWVDWITRETVTDGTGCLWSRGLQLGDWLSLDGVSVHGGTDRGFIATAFYWYSAALTAKSAQILGQADIARKYSALADRIRAAFVDEYFTSSGRLAVDTQTACAVVLYLDLLPEGARERTAQLLYRKLMEAGVRLETGFVGTAWLMPALTRCELSDIAYGLLLREEYPGWLYEVNRGATTIWERWNSIEPDGEMNRDGMNSFNHYAYGSVAAWMYRTIGGINPVETAPGFRCIDCRPVPDPRLDWAETTLMTGSGLCRTAWQWKDRILHLQVEVPFGCVMRLTLPHSKEPLHLPAGQYSYDIAMPAPATPGLDAPWRTVLDTPATRAVIERLFPRAIRGIAFQYEMYTMRQLTQSPFCELSREEICKLDEELKKAQAEA